MVLPDRRKNLERISGLDVRIRREKGQNVFEFFRHTRMVYTVFTYPKALAFAHGVKFGFRPTTTVIGETE